MLRQRLFWKLFLSFWLALLLFALGVLYAASVYLDATRARYDGPSGRNGGDPIFNVAQEAADTGHQGLQDWARHIDATELVPVLVLDANEKDILGREPSARALGRLAFMLKNHRDGAGREHHRRPPVVLPDGREYWLVPDFQSASLSRLISRPHVVAAQLILATLIGAIVCLALAAYLTAPLRRLREATVAYGSGDFSHRVTPTLGRRRDEIVDLAQSLDTMAERIDALIAAQRGLLRDVSHELRSPLARVQVAVGLARQRVGDQADGELARIDAEMERLNELIGRIIDFSRLDAGLHAARHDELRLEQIVGDVAADVRMEAEAKGCILTTELPDQAPLRGDAALLASAIENVLRNALRHSPAGGEILLSLSREAAQWRIVIADRGPGIPEELHTRVFEPFFRVDDHRNPQGGIGLGLAIARQAIATHGGRIELKNRSGGGLEVSLCLPLTPETTP